MSKIVRSDLNLTFGNIKATFQSQRAWVNEQESIT